MEKKKRVYRFLLSNNKIFLHIRWQCFLNVVKINTMSSITQSKNFCYLTGKTKVDLPNISLREEVQYISLSIYKHFSFNISKWGKGVTKYLTGEGVKYKHFSIHFGRGKTYTASL